MKSRSFWSANLSELLERVAFYGMTPMLVLFLTESRGFSNAAAIRIGGNFGMVTYGLAALSGFLADWVGYRRAMILAYTLLATGYFLTGQSQGQWGILGSLFLVAFGASLIKPIITGTVQKTCDERQRSVGFSIYYMLVNIGGFLGPNLSALVRDAYGVDHVFQSSAAAATLALGVALFLYQEPPAVPGEVRRSLRDFAGDFGRVVRNGRLMLLFGLVAGWWSMFFQFLNVLPLYLRDDVGVSPWLLGFLPSLNALTVICLQVPIGWVVRRFAPFRAIVFAVLVSSAGVALIGLHPSAVLAGAGVVIFALGEIVYSAHFYNYLGTLAPPGQVGMYMGFAFLPIAAGSFLSGQIGAPVSAYFRDVLHAPQQMWFAFAGVGLAAAAGLWLLTRTGARDTPLSP